MKKQVVFSIFSLFLSGSSFACICSPGSVAEHYERATYVFSAVVTSTRHLPAADVFEELQRPEINDFIQNYRVREASVRLTAAFKGDTLSPPVVYSVQSTCGIELSQGEEYLFFAGDRGLVGLCSGNVARSNPNFLEAVGDVRRLQAGFAPDE